VKSQKKGEEKMKGKVHRFLVAFPLIALLASSPSLSFAGEVDILMRKLVEKGILTKQDAESIVQEIRQETPKQEKEQQKVETKKIESKEAEVPQWAKKLPDWVINPPDWIKNIKLSGDLRLRYQWEDRKDDDKEDRNRGRFRLRLGAETRLVDEVKVGFGLASGSGDPRSTNVTFENTFEKKNVKIDYAFAEYKPAKWFSVIGGKFQNLLYRPSDLLWDTDITPEGAAAKFKHSVLHNLELFFNSGFFILDERSSNKDPFMVALRTG